jgi:NAD(P)-dependent dehydrogenase (short-subunit alcohol dehydrogenase family)/3-oxoacyl-(acyl-carrier-protein) synthase
MGELSGKLALVTGGAKNIGREIAGELAARGADLIINYFHSSDAAKQSKIDLERAGTSVTLVRGSVAQEAHVNQMFDTIQERYGHLDILINNAAAGALVPADQLTEDYLDRAWNTNLKGAIWCARRAAPLMATRGGGAIVNVSSLGARLVLHNYLASAPAKAAVEALTRYLAVEYAPLGIRVNSASASMLVSEVADAFPDSAELLKVIADATPFGRLGTPKEFADVVAFLVSEQSRWITGQTIVVDGGLALGASLCSPPRERPPEPAAAVSPARVTNRDDPASDDDIAIVGMGMVCGGANSPAEYWAMRLSGAELFADVPPDRWTMARFCSADESAEDKAYQGRGVFVTGFEPEPDQELTTSWLRHSLTQALSDVTRHRDDRCSLTIGYTADGSQHLEEAGVLASVLETMDRDPDLTAPQRAEITTALRHRFARALNEPSRFLPNRVGSLVRAGLLPDDTDVSMVDTACSSSLYAMDIAIKGLLLGKHDIAVCGGALALGPRNSILFAKLNGLSHRGNIRSFDRSADGVIFADGAGLVTLKKLSRARADGDPVLAVIRAVGGSSDGKGTAIYAPNRRGQDLAIERAIDGSGGSIENVDWIVAHGTGTPAGDLTEHRALRGHYGNSHRVYLTSNKSIIGHTGWAAGVLSVIEAVLGITHNTIPPQMRFEAPPDELLDGDSDLTIPVAPVPWPPRDAPRAVAVSGFGFGGTNAHAVVEEYRPGAVRTRTPRPEPGRIAIVGWAAHLPGDLSDTEVTDWLLNNGQSPATGFGESYPPPPMNVVSLPPATVRRLDRTQLMVLSGAAKIRGRLGDFWDAHRGSTGVFIGHMGPTRNAMEYADRCYLDDLSQVISNAGVMSAIRTEYQRRIAPSNEDSFPGLMPNIIAARVANQFDLNGPAMTVDTGFSSTLTAIDIACRYLRTGAIDLAIVGGANGNSLPAYRAVLGDLAEGELAEGAFVFALVDERLASKFGLPVLGYVDDAGDRAQRQVDSPDRGFLGAAGGPAILRALLGTPGTVDVTCPNGDDPPAVLRLTVNPPVPALPSGNAPALRRYTSVLAEVLSDPLLPTQPFLPSGVVVLTDQPELLAHVPVPPDALVLSARPGDVDVETVRRAIGGHPVRHIRIVTNLRDADPDQVLALHDLLFLVLHVSQLAVEEAGGSVVGVFLDSIDRGKLNPFSGLFTGLLKVACLEMPRCQVFGLFATTADVRTGARLAERESTQRRLFPIVIDENGTRKTLVLNDEPINPSESDQVRLTGDSVVLAIGGARGITAELLKALALRSAPKIHILGSNPIYSYPAEVYSSDEAEFGEWCKNYVKVRLAEQPSLRPAAAAGEVRRIRQARVARHNVVELENLCGPDRVRYSVCDVSDSAAVDQVLGEIMADEEQIDLLIHAAGLNSSAMIAEKDFTEFRTIRDTKVRGYLNLKRALRERPPVTWCNFGSLAAVTGQQGEADYTAGNDFLVSAATWATAIDGADELTIGWTQWGETGMVVRDTLTKAYYDEAQYYTMMSNEEGAHHFFLELSAARRSSCSAYMGEAELRTFDRLYPGYLEFGGDHQRLGFFLRKFTRREPDSVEFECTLSLEVDEYLRHHLVRGTPTLPGSFMAEIAAEAAAVLVPDLDVVGLRRMAFHKFVKVYEGRPPVTKKIAARIVERTSDGAVVNVRITADLVAPGGVLLASDQLYFETTVLLRSGFPATPGWAPWQPAEEFSVSDPYYSTGSPVLLTDEFTSTSDLRLHPLGRRAKFVLNHQPIWTRFAVPAILIDGMARLTSISSDRGGTTEVSVPTFVEGIDLYQRANDLDLGNVEMFATNEKVVAVRSDGTVVAVANGIEAALIGRVSTDDKSLLMVNS